MRGGQQQQQQANPSLDFFLLLSFIFALVALVWYFFSPQITSGIFTLREYEINGVTWLVRLYQKIISWFPAVIQKPLSADVTALEATLGNIVNEMNSADLNNIHYGQLFFILRSFGVIMIVPIIAISIAFGGMLVFFSRGNRYKRTYSMATLSQEESQNWHEIIPVLNKDIIKQDLDQAPWGMSVQPLSFAKKYGLVESDRQHNKNVAKLNQEKAYRIFASQMGPRWTGLEGLSGYILALFAIFAAKSQHDTSGSRQLLRQISASAKTGKLDFGGTRELLVKHVRAPSIGRAVGPHAYLYGVMASMLALAREDGVLAVAEFIWLKPLDRPLWYMLTSVGRQTAFPEMAGPFAHWLVERRLRRPLVVPMIGRAIDALGQSLSEFIYNPEDT